MIALKNILVATDFGEAAEAALTYGRALARGFGATLHVLHVTNNIYMETMGAGGFGGALYDDMQGDVNESARVQLHGLLVDNDPNPLPSKAVVKTSNAPADAIVSYAREAQIDLIVVGTHGHGPVAHLLLGSVAERVVRTAPCPVLSVRHPEREFVVPETLAAVTRA